MNLAQLIDKLAQQGVTLGVLEERLVVQTTQGKLDTATQTLLDDFAEEIVLWLSQQSRIDNQHTLPQVIDAPAERYAPFPLTDIQHAYWVGRSGSFALGDVGTHGYFEIACPTLDLDRLNQAWQRIIARHEMLRAIVTPDGQQQILRELPDWQLTVYDLRGQSPRAVEAHIACVRDELSHQVLPADRWPLFDIRASHLDGAETRLHLSLDLLFCDLASLLLVLNEWQQLYQQPELVLPAPQLSFRDYVLAAQTLEATPLYQQAEAYWRNRLATLPPAPALPLAQEPTRLTRTRTQRRAAQVDRPTWQQLQQRAQQQGVTANGVLLAAFAEVLTVWSKEPTFTLTLTLFNRLPLHPQVDEVIGDFTTINLLAVDNRQPAPFGERAQRLQKQVWDDLDQRAFSGVRVLRELARQRGAPPGAVQMPIIFTSGLGVAAGRGFHPFGKLVYGSSQTPQAWLDHIVIEEEGVLTIYWDAVEVLFPTGLLDDLFAAYCDLLHRLANDGTTWQMAHPVSLPPAQQAQRAAVNDMAAPSTDELLHTLFLKQLPAHANQPAVITTQRCLPYAELYQRASQVGHWLRAQGARPNTLVAVVMEKGWEQVVAVLGIHLAGAAYLPIDPNLPCERQHYLLEQSKAVLALTQSWLANELVWPRAIQALAVDTLTPTQALAPLPLIQQPGDLAYVIYTSGSTGQPKGVMIDHRGAVNTVLEINRRFGVTAQDRVLALSALNFDLSVYDIFGLLAVGGAIVLPDPDQRTDPAHWLDLMQQHRVTLWDTVPALMQMLVDTVESRQGDKVTGWQDDKVTRWQDDKVTGWQGDKVTGWQGDKVTGWQGDKVTGWQDDKVTRWQGLSWKDDKVTELVEVTLSPCHPVTLSPLRLVMLSGDWIPVTLPDRIKACWPGATVYGLGGATEASIWSNYFLIEQVDPAWPSIPYGKPLCNQSFQVLDANLNPRPVWVPGDLYIGGLGLALGYWQDAEKTAAKFISHPQTGERLYKTGDLARYWPDGNLEFLGREDFQVKIRGHRVELGEIEAALRQHPNVKEAVVNAMGDPKSLHKQLVAYVVLKEDVELIDAPAVLERYAIALGNTMERAEFKLKQQGVRTFNGEARIDLLRPVEDNAFRQPYLARQSYRQFSVEPIPFAQFSQWLSCLSALKLPDKPLPKYRYPSADALYPVQTYLYIKPGRVEGIAEGFYYYHPLTHQLVLLTATATLDKTFYSRFNQSFFDAAAFALFLVAQLNAIIPMTGKLSYELALLEAGYMSQLLMEQSPAHQIGLCPIAGLPVEAVQRPLQLDENHLLVHSLLAGHIDPQQTTDWLGEREPSQIVAWREQLRAHLQARLPTYMIPATYIKLPALPLSANGKVDRAALPIPTSENASAPVATLAPNTPLEAQIAASWCELFQQKQVSVDQNFFDLGGDSLLATRLLARLRQQFQLDLALRTLYTHPTIRQLADVIQQQELANADQQALQAILAELMEG